VIKQIAVSNVWKVLSSDKDAILIDVRNESEWREGLPDIGSIDKNVELITISNNVDAFENELHDRVLNREACLIFICRSGARSDLAAQIAKNLGYVNSCNLVGGFQEWLKQGLAHKQWRNR
jgi:rhodanese-related sulfurtransferase